MPEAKASKHAPPESPQNASGATETAAEAPALVRGRWTGPEPVFNPEQGVIAPGGEIWVTPEQLADPATLVVPIEEGR